MLCHYIKNLLIRKYIKSSIYLLLCGSNGLLTPGKANQSFAIIIIRVDRKYNTHTNISSYSLKILLIFL